MLKKRCRETCEFSAALRGGYLDVGQWRNCASKRGILAEVLRASKPGPIGVPCEIRERGNRRHFHFGGSRQCGGTASVASFRGRYTSCCLDVSQLFLQRVPVFRGSFRAQFL